MRLVPLAAALAVVASAARAQGDISIAAARVEILALRAAVPRHTPVRGDSLWLDRDSAMVSRDSAARRLARLSKPEVCEGTPERGALRITCQRLEDLRAEDIATHLFEEYWSDYGSLSVGGFMRDVHKNHPTGFDTLRVLCTGRDSIVVPAAAGELWQRDYWATVNWYALHYNFGDSDDLDHEDRGLFPTFLFGMGDGEGMAARLRFGVVSLFRFSASEDQQGRFFGSISGGGPTNVTQDQQMAILADQMRGLALGTDEARLRPALAKLAAMFAHYWAGHGSMPASASEFVNRYGRDH